MSGNTNNEEGLGRISVSMKQHTDKNRGTVNLGEERGCREYWEEWREGRLRSGCLCVGRINQ